MSRLIVAASWCVVSLHAAAMVFSIFGSAGFVATALVAGTPVLMLSTMFAGVAAAGFRRWDLLAGTASLLVWSLLTASGAYPPASAHPAAAADLGSNVTPTLTVVSSNVRAGNPSLAQAVDELAGAAPDVVVLLEITDDDVAVLLDTPLAVSHPYMVLNPLDGYFGSAVFSRVPLEGRIVDVGGYPMIEATAETTEGSVDLIAVHVAAPLSGEGHRLWSDQLADLEARLAAAERPTIVAGDFNATPHHLELRRLAAHGSRTGLGAAPTYPADSVVPAFLGLDHVFTGGGACLHAVDVLDGIPGSDHRALMASIGVSYTHGADCR